MHYKWSVMKSLLLADFTIFHGIWSRQNRTMFYVSVVIKKEAHATCLSIEWYKYNSYLMLEFTRIVFIAIAMYERA